MPPAGLEPATLCLEGQDVPPASARPENVSRYTTTTYARGPETRHQPETARNSPVCYRERYRDSQGDENSPGLGAS